MHESDPGIESLRQTQAAAFLELAVRSALDAHRDVPGSWRENRTLDEVLNDLPTYQGDTLTTVMRALRPERRTVLDLGSGDNAVALSQLVESFDGSIRGAGVTLPLDRADASHPSNVAVIREDVNEFLRGLANQPDEARPSIMYSVKMFRWLADPLGTLQLAYNALSHGGYLFIDEIYNEQMPLVSSSGQPVDPRNLEATLHDAGYDVTFGITEGTCGGMIQAYSVVMRKNGQATLTLPVRLVDMTQLGIQVDSNQHWDTPFENLGYPTRLLYMLG